MPSRWPFALLLSAVLAGVAVVSTAPAGRAAAYAAATSPIAPAPPASVTAGTPTASSVPLSWSASTSLTTSGYDVYLDGATVAQTGGTSTTVGGLACGTSHTFGVAAYDALGDVSGPTTTTASTAPCPDTTPPSQPASLALGPPTASSLPVSWSASSDNVGVAGYDVYLDGTRAAQTAATSYTLSGLACATSYAVAVDAYDAAGNVSARTSASAATVACAPPPAPTGIAQVGATGSSVTLSWQASAGASGYYLYRSGVELSSTSATTATWGGLNCGSPYRFSVQAYDSAGVSARVDYEGSTAACGGDPPPSDTTPPTPPGNLTVGAVDQTSVAVSWSASSDDVGVAGYDLYVNGGEVGTTGSESYTFAGLACGTSYALAVAAYDAAGNTSQQASASASTRSCSSRGGGGGTGNVFVSANGSDGGANCKRFAAPVADPDSSGASLCRSFEQAFQLAVRGDTVVVEGGTYPGQTVSADASEDSGSGLVTFEPAARATVTVSGELRLSGVRHVEFDGMDVGDYYVGVNSPSGAGQTGDIVLRDMTVRTFTMRSVAGLSMLGGSVGDITGGCGSGCTPFPGTVATSASAEPIIGAVYCGGGGCSATTPQSSNVLIDGVHFHDVYRVQSSGVHSACLWVSSVEGLTIRDSTFDHCDSQTIHMTYEPSYPSSANGSVSTNVLLENDFVEPPTDNGGTSSGASTLTIRDDVTQGDCLRNWVLRNNTILGATVVSTNGTGTGCDSNVVSIGNILGTFTDADGNACGGTTLATPIVFRYDVFQDESCGASDVDLHGGSYGLQSSSDYHLTSSSPARGVVPSSAYGVPAAYSAPGPDAPSSFLASDVDGQIRPQPGGGPNDAGADEVG